MALLGWPMTISPNPGGPGRTKIALTGGALIPAAMRIPLRANEAEAPIKSSNAAAVLGCDVQFVRTIAAATSSP